MVVGFFAYFFVFILTGISFLRERIGGTLERLLATPVSRAEIVLGYSLGFGFFATIQVALVLAFVLGRLEIPALGPMPAFAIGLGVHTIGNPLIAYLIVLMLGLGAVSLGIFISTFARTEFQILQFIPIVIVPQGSARRLLLADRTAARPAPAGRPDPAGHLRDRRVAAGDDRRRRPARRRRCCWTWACWPA